VALGEVAGWAAVSTARMLLSGDGLEALDGATRADQRSVGRFLVKGWATAVEVFDVFAADTPDVRARLGSSEMRSAGSTATGPPYAGRVPRNVASNGG